METRALGSLKVSVVGVGCNNFGMRVDEDSAAAVVNAALDAGITLFDTADSYGRTESERYLGKALGKHRDEVVIATKFASPIDDDETHRGASARWVKEAVDGSLRRLGTDHIDLYQQHFPDTSVPVEETLGALDELVKAGKVREIGNSNYSGEQIDQAAAISAKEGFASFVSAQNYLNLLERGPLKDVLPACERHGLGQLPYFPLASGLLTGKYTRGEAPPPGTRLAGGKYWESFLSDDNFALVDRLSAFAEARDHTILELAFAWLLAQQAMASVIAGATTPGQVAANAAAAEWQLTKDDLSEMDDLLE
jgi:aryl-alcohol dehydrogenase-like predicted oxidoreductase